MMLPAAIGWPPNIFTPSLWPGESRPLREEPPAFLWAMLRFRSRGNSRDLHLCEVLAGAALPDGVLATLLLEGDHIRPATMLENFCLHLAPGGERGAAFGQVPPQQQHHGERDLRAHFAFERGE